MRSGLQTRADSQAFRSMCEELLARGVIVRFRANGRSMQPNILDGDALLVGPLATGSARYGDIALTRDKSGLRAHRVIASDEHSNNVLTRGDAGLHTDPSPGMALGKVISIERGSRSSRANGLGARIRHSFRIKTNRAVIAARHRFHMPVFGIFGLLLFSLMAVFPASGQSLNVSIAANPTPNVAPMDAITYTINLSNTSGRRVTGAAVSMVLPNYPANLYSAYNSATATPVRGGQAWTCNFTAATQTISCADANNYASNDTTTLTFVVTVLATAPAGTTLLGTVVAQGTNFPGGSRATAPVTVQVPKLAITNTPTPNPIAPGDTLTYAVGLSNTSGVNAVANETVTMADPVDTTFVSATATSGTGAWTCNNTGGIVTCTDTANYNKGSATNFSFVFTVNAGTPNGTVIPSTVNAQAANTQSSGTASSSK